ncbi:MAG: hypothetical protein IT556_11890 [Acetobacteraceae bacterium]|nr:hypothetical protein [Acetobacteraceae bacterium]
MSNLGNAGQTRAAALLRGESVSAFTAPFSIGLGLAADDSGLTGEPVGNGYARQPFVFAGNGAAMSNANAISFGPFTADLGVVRGFVIFDAGGGVMWRGELSNQLSLASGQTRSIAAGAITGSID